LDFFASQSLIVLWTHPLHFISCQHVILIFHEAHLLSSKLNRGRFTFSLDSILFHIDVIVVVIIDVIHVLWSVSRSGLYVMTAYASFDLLHRICRCLRFINLSGSFYF